MIKEINFSISMLDAALVVKMGAPQWNKFSPTPPHPPQETRWQYFSTPHVSFAIPASQVYYESNENAMARQF